LAGERGGDRIDGFDFGNSPLEFRENVPSRIITTTTNGTIALRSCDGAAEVLAGALLNLGAIAAHLLVIDCPIAVLLCAGTGTEAALEDILAAGMLCSRFPDAHLSDAAQAARAVYERYAGAVLEGLLASKNGRALIEKGRRQEVEWCAQTSTCTVVGRLQEGVVRPFPVPLEG
jgi:2-phosphosulfolactate phosphatase